MRRPGWHDRGMECRSLAVDDIAAAPPWLEGVDLRPDRWRDDATRAAAGIEGGDLVAVGRIFTSAVHQSRYWVEVVVAPDRRRLGHGRRLVEHLAGLRTEPKPLCTRGYVSSEAVLFARSLGARPYQTCPPQRVATADTAGLSATGPVTLTGRDVSQEELERAWTDTYAWVHASWSPVAPGFEGPLLAEFGRDLDLAHTRVVVDSTVRAAAFVFGDGDEPVVVAECRTADEPQGRDLLRACVRDSLAALAADGFATVTFDGHDSDPFFRPLLAELPTTGERFELLERPSTSSTPTCR